MIDRRALIAESQRLAWQLMIEAIWPSNNFYRQRLVQHRQSLGDSTRGWTCEDAKRLPLDGWPTLDKEALTRPLDGDGWLTSHRPDLAPHHTYPIDRYVRWHRTSGTRGQPLAILDTADDWRWWLRGWQPVLDQAHCAAGQSAVMLFSFGPFIGFWSAFDALVQRGVTTIPAGGLSSPARLELLKQTRPAIVGCTPSYALHLAEVARSEGFDLCHLGVRSMIVAGEPGGSIAATRAAIDRAWGTTVIDHAGATEVGPWGVGTDDGRGIQVNEELFIAEVLHPGTLDAVEQGGTGELVLTSLGRNGCPVIRYRTGDLVRPQWQHDYRRPWLFLDGGVIGRVDDMLVIRGVNVFPSSIEAIVRQFAEVREYQLRVYRESELDQIELLVEDGLADPTRIARAIDLHLGLRVPVRIAPDGSLPRFESKGRRVDDRRAIGDDRSNANDAHLKMSRGS
jgi:phenylacetate-CoA ligase